MLTAKIQPSSMAEPHICSCEILIWQSNPSITLIRTISVLSTMQQFWQTRQLCSQPVAQELFLFSSPSTHSCPNLISTYFRLFVKCCIALYRVQYPALKSKMQLLPQQHCPWRYSWGAGNETKWLWWKDLSFAAWGRQHQHAWGRVILSLTATLKHSEPQFCFHLYFGLLGHLSIRNRDHTKELSPSRTDTTFYINSIHMDFCIIDHFIGIC